MMPTNHSLTKHRLTGPIDIDRQHLHQTYQAVIQLNQLRLEHTRNGLNQHQRIFLDTLPLLLHFNHPMLPGYIAKETPAKISDFHPNEHQLHQLTLMAKGFHASQQQSLKQQADILGVFIMGSAGSIAYNKKSDLDIWVCYRSGLQPEHLIQLEEKCSELQQWASRLHLDVSLFLMNDDKFCQGQDSSLDKESSGSTQHYLLLDEFYRTCVHLAGLLPIWFFIKENEPNSYYHYRTEIINNRFLPCKNFIDFGPIPVIPPSEFVSAAIWQLYKAIESPYKSLLKLLVLEAYVYQEKNAPLVSDLSKQKIYTNIDNNIDNNLINTDPYLQLYNYLESYLEKTQQQHRLDLLRQCFYIKINISLSNKKNDNIPWQKKALHALTKEWGWDNTYLRHLDNRKAWKVKSVSKERKKLVSEITRSYQLIVTFFKKSNVKISSSTKEINILGRKLNAAFSVKSGKINWINPSISENITENTITLNEIQAEDLHYWQAYDEKGGIVKENASIAYLLAWLHCNNIIDSNTEINYGSPNKAEFYTFKKWLTQQLPSSIKPEKHQNYTKKSTTKKLIITINEIKKYGNTTDKNWFKFLLDNIESIDVLHLNSWNEVFHKYFKHQAITNMIRYYCDLFYQEKNEFTAKPNIHIKNNAINRIVQNELLSFISELNDFFKNNIHGHYIFLEEDLKMVIYYRQGKAVIENHKNTNTIIKKLSASSLHYQALVVKNETQQSNIISCIAEYCKSGSIQLFFTPNGNSANIIIADEKGSFFQKNIIYDRGIHSLKPIHRFLRTISERRIESYLGSGNIGPMDMIAIEFYELKKQHKVWQCQRQAINSNLEHFNFINVIATIEDIDTDNSYQPKNFTINCEDEEFSSEQHRRGVYRIVAQYIISKRQHQARYPCYITDIDLCACQLQLNNGETPQTIGYLKVQHFLELNINRALDQL